MPEGITPDLPGPVKREIRNHVRTRELGEDVALAIFLAGEAIDDDAPAAALPYLEWAKEVAPRAPAIREALAVARYLAEDFKGALNELRSYRRLSAANDQDHLIADCLRALGHPPSEVGDVVLGLLRSTAPADRKVEGVLVWAGAVADGGDLAAARAVLRRAEPSLLSAAGADARDRFTYLTGDLAERDGDAATARRAFESLVGLDDDPYEVGPRLAGLPEGG